MKEFFLRLLGYKKSTGPVYRDRSNVMNVLIKDNPASTKAWIDAFPVGTCLRDETGRGWIKREEGDGRWEYYEVLFTSTEMSGDGRRWTWIRSENENRD